LLAVLALYAAQLNRAGEAREVAHRALACEPYPPPLDISMPLIIALTLVECYDELQRLCRDLLAISHRRGAMQELVGISGFRAWASFECGALADSEADARWALERAEGASLRNLAVTEVIRVLVEREELEAAEGVLEQLVDPRASWQVDVPRFLLRGASCVSRRAAYRRRVMTSWSADSDARASGSRR
jgi:hypothetical protein